MADDKKGDGFAGDGFINPEDKKNNELLDVEKKQIEQIKKEERTGVMSAQEFAQRRKKTLNSANAAYQKDDFAFKAEIKDGKRSFNVKGFADKKHLYRGAKMKQDDNQYVYFFGSSYDALYAMNDERQLTVNGWTYNRSKKYWEQTPISKNQLADVKSITVEEAEEKIEKIKAQGDNPLA